MLNGRFNFLNSNFLALMKFSGADDTSFPASSISFNPSWEQAPIPKSIVAVPPIPIQTDLISNKFSLTK